MLRAMGMGRNCILVEVGFFFFLFFPFANNFLICKHRNQHRFSTPKLQDTQNIYEKISTASQYRKVHCTYLASYPKSVLHPIVPLETFCLVPLRDTIHHLLNSIPVFVLYRRTWLESRLPGSSHCFIWGQCGWQYQICLRIIEAY